MKKRIKPIVAAIFICSSLITFAAPALAGNGDGTGGGTGNGTGGNADIALTLISSSIKNGDADVPLNPVVDLQFNKNVVNLTIKSGNSKCFHLADSRGDVVTIKVIFPDDQLRKEFREHIFITPVENLALNTKYTLYIDKTLQAKNSKTFDNTQTITFTTGTKSTTAVNASLKSLGDDIEVFTNKLPIPDSGLNKGSSATASGKPSFSFNNASLSVIIIGFILTVVVVFFGILLFIKKKNNNNNSSDHS